MVETAISVASRWAAPSSRLVKVAVIPSALFRRAAPNALRRPRLPRLTCGPGWFGLLLGHAFARRRGRRGPSAGVRGAAAPRLLSGDGLRVVRQPRRAAGHLAAGTAPQDVLGGIEADRVRGSARRVITS